MKITARIDNSKDNHQVTLQTNDNVHSIVIPPKSTGYGSSVNGGELLFLALATCYCNDIYREAAKRNIQIDRVEVAGDLGAEGDPATNVTYRAKVTSQASEQEIQDMLRFVDTVAEIQNTLRVVTSVTLSQIEVNERLRDHMGASGWTYFVPYQSDITQALNEFREQVFQSGKFYKREPFWQDMDDDEYADAPDEDLRQQLTDWLRTMKSMKEPTTIEELLMWNGEDGTHSMIDITGISSTPDFGKAAPLSSQQLMNLFGTEKPTQNMVEEKAVVIMQLRERWQATYIIIYKAELPDKIFFTGYSGD